MKVLLIVLLACGWALPAVAAPDVTFLVLWQGYLRRPEIQSKVSHRTLTAEPRDMHEKLSRLIKGDLKDQWTLPIPLVLQPNVGDIPASMAEQIIAPPKIEIERPGTLKARLHAEELHATLLNAAEQISIALAVVRSEQQRIGSLQQERSGGDNSRLTSNLLEICRENLKYQETILVTLTGLSRKQLERTLNTSVEEKFAQEDRGQAEPAFRHIIVHFDLKPNVTVKSENGAVLPALPEDDVNDYIRRSVRKVKKAWFPGGCCLNCSTPTVRFTVLKTGRIENVRLVQSSGSGKHDQAAIAAVVNGFQENQQPAPFMRLDCEITFKWSVPSPRDRLQPL